MGMKPVSPLLVEWDNAQLGERVDDVLEVYAEAMAVNRAAARGRRAVLAGHLDRRGLRAVAALDGDRLVGIAYGYLGSPGQWWHDRVGEALDPELVESWLLDAFEVCELHVRPALHGTGLGRDLLLKRVKPLDPHSVRFTLLLGSQHLVTRRVDDGDAG